MGPVLVTGGAGFVGGHLTRALLRRGRDVVVLDLAPALPPYARDGGPGGKVTYLRGNATDPGKITEALVKHGASDVVHAAGLVADVESLGNPLLFLKNNAESAWLLCEIARHVPTVRRIVAISTRGVYGKYLPEEGPTDESFVPRPEAFYGAAKAAADLATVLYREHFGLDVVVARLVGAYGPHQNYPHPLGLMVDAAVEGKELRWSSGSDYLREYTYVKDTVRGLLTLLDAKHLQHPIYNVSSGRQTPLSELAAAIRKIVPGAVIELGPGWLENAAARAAQAVDRIANETGFRARTSLEDGLREVIEWKRHGSYGVEIE